MHRSKLDIGGADAGANSMSISSGSSASACSGVPSSSSSDSSAMAHTGGPSGSMCLAKSSSRAWSAAASVTASRKSSSLWARKRRHQSSWFLSQRSVTARATHSAEDCRSHALFMTTSSNEPSKTERARVTLACAWMQLLKLRKTATSQGCK